MQYQGGRGLDEKGLGEGSSLARCMGRRARKVSRELAAEHIEINSSLDWEGGALLLEGFGDQGCLAALSPCN